jgi:hypothetical protein
VCWIRVIFLCTKLLASLNKIQNRLSRTLRTIKWRAEQHWIVKIAFKSFWRPCSTVMCLKRDSRSQTHCINCIEEGQLLRWHHKVLLIFRKTIHWPSYQCNRFFFFFFFLLPLYFFVFCGSSSCFRDRPVDLPSPTLSVTYCRLPVPYLEHIYGFPPTVTSHLPTSTLIPRSFLTLIFISETIPTPNEGYRVVITDSYSGVQEMPLPLFRSR